MEIDLNTSIFVNSKNIHIFTESNCVATVASVFTALRPSFRKQCYNIQPFRPQSKHNQGVLLPKVAQRNAQWSLWDQPIALVWKVDTAATQIPSDGSLGLQDVISSASLYGTGPLSQPLKHMFLASQMASHNPVAPQEWPRVLIGRNMRDAGTCSGRGFFFSAPQKGVLT